MIKNIVILEYKIVFVPEGKFILLLAFRADLTQRRAHARGKKGIGSRSPFSVTGYGDSRVVTIGKEEVVGGCCSNPFTPYTSATNLRVT